MSQPVNNRPEPEWPITYQAVTEYFRKLGEAKPFTLRKQTFERIEALTGRPLICYVSRTYDVPQGLPTYIDDGDLTGFSDLVNPVEGGAIDVFLVSNGGSVEATERIVRLIRGQFQSVRFILPANAYSAATLLSFAGDQIIMDSIATLGPIDPQINGVPARAILRAFEAIEGRLKDEGPRALTAYMPLISKYDLHILEICKSAQELSKELAGNWLSTHMLKCDETDSRVTSIKNYFSDYDSRKSHSRSIDRAKARELGLNIVNVEEIEGLPPLVRSLHNQYIFMFDKSPFYKVFESSKGINWGRESRAMTIQVPLAPAVPSSPGSPERSR